MAVDIKKLKNAPDWVDKVGDYGSISKSASVIKELLNENKAYDEHEIQDMIGRDTIIGSPMLEEMVEAQILDSRSGMYYVKDKSRAKELIQLCD